MIAVSTSPHQTAEWQCTRCGTTNRKFVGAALSGSRDRCASCHTRHELTRGPRPVRWEAKPL